MARKKKSSEAIEEGRGFAEAPQAAFDVSETGKLAPCAANPARLTLGPGGRIVIPAAMRAAMEIDEGGALLAWVDEGELHLLSPRVGARQAQAMLQGVLPKGASLADELIADRRRETESEARG
jgi:bifunctional DNA-binding transcriptional regulator/antitoxin component of YhaV-PrlF toxin-antitoxin module